MAVQVGYNVQTAVNTEHKLIVAHDVTKAPVDRDQLLSTAKLAQQVLKQKSLKVIADRGYYKGEAIQACYRSGIHALVPKPLTSQSKAKGLFDKQDFHYDAEHDQYRCPAGEVLTRRETYLHKGIRQTTYQASTKACRDCRLKPQCFTGKTRRAVRRSEHDDLLEARPTGLRRHQRRCRYALPLLEHPFGTIKSWMGTIAFSNARRLKNVRTEMSLHVLAYNMKRMISIVGAKPLMEAMQA